MPRQHRVKHRSKGVNVGRRPRAFFDGLLRGHVFGRPDEHAALCPEGRARHQFGDAEVAEFGLPLASQ